MPDSLSEGPVLPFTKITFLALFYVGVIIGALLFFDPSFANFRWPWDLNAFDSRIMAAFPTGVAVWSVTMYFLKDWAEVKIGFRGISLAVIAVFLMSIITMVFMPSWWVAGKHNIPTFPLATGALSLMLLYSYWKQEVARPKKKG